MVSHGVCVVCGVVSHGVCMVCGALASHGQSWCVCVCQSVRCGAVMVGHGVGVSQVWCVGESWSVRRREEEEGGGGGGRRREEEEEGGGGTAQKVRTPHKDVGKNKKKKE